MCHAFDQDAKDGHDLLIGLNSVMVKKSLPKFNFSFCEENLSIMNLLFLFVLL